jgi:hypothetical protein
LVSFDHIWRRAENSGWLTVQRDAPTDKVQRKNGSVALIDVTL